MSPDGLPDGFGTGARMVDSTVQSLTRVTVMVLSMEEERSFPREGKWRLVTVEEWCIKDPTSRFLKSSVWFDWVVFMGRSEDSEECVDGGGATVES